MNKSEIRLFDDAREMNFNRRIFDVVVLGAGPAGSSIAANLARAGMHVLIFDNPPRSTHTGGEFISASARSILRRSRFKDGHWEEGHLAAQEFISTWGTGYPIARNYIFEPHGHALVLDRAGFNRALLLQATGAGAIRLEKARLARADLYKHIWSLTFDVQDSHFEVRCGFLVAATGRGGYRLRNVGIQRHQVDKLVCFGAEVDRYDGDARPLVESYKNGWAYSVRLPSNKLMLNLFTEADCRHNLKRSFDFFLGEVAQCPLTTSRMLSCQPRRADQVSFFITSASSAYRRPVAGPGWCLAGDQAQSMDPLSSKGISQALQHAERVSEIVIGNGSSRPASLSKYSTELEEAYNSYLAERWRVYGFEKRWNTPFWTKRSIEPRLPDSRRSF